MSWEKEFEQFVEEKHYTTAVEPRLLKEPDVKAFIESQMSDLRKEVEKKKEGLMTDNNGSPTCNPRCHDSGKETALNEVLLLLDALSIINPSKE